jgi:hypothetical protein
MDVRLDNKFNDRNSAFVRYTYSITRFLIASLPGATGKIYLRRC